MAVYESTPVQHEDHYIQSDSSSSGVWAVLAVIIVLLALLLFGSRLFTRNNNSGSGTNINGSGSVQTPSGDYQGSGSVNSQ